MSDCPSIFERADDPYKHLLSKIFSLVRPTRHVCEVSEDVPVVTPKKLFRIWHEMLVYL
jgi:hypothetical protein